METKVTIQHLVGGLCQRAGIPFERAGEFAHAFFDLIAEKVVQEKTVKVKGLGTFKLIEMSDRESVDVNTGERILIPGHSKVSFTPDSALRDQVNKPFADFQTVILNEGTSIEEMEQPMWADDEGDEELIPLNPVTGEPLEDEEEIAAARRAFNAAADETPMPPVEVEPAAEAVPAKEPDLEPAAEPVPAVSSMSEPVQEAPQVKIIHKGVSPWFTLVYVLLTLFLMGLSYYAGYHRLLAPDTQVPKSEKVSHKSKPSEPAAAVKAKPFSPADSLAEARRQVMKTASQHPQVPGGKYLIVGTRRVHTMKAGDSLLKLALKEYGHKDFAQYIIIYNQFPNPDVIPVGQEVKLPELIENGAEGES